MLALSNFSNREIATFLWLLVAVAIGLSKKEIRESFSQVLKSLFHVQILLSLAFMLVLVALITSVLRSISLWDWVNIKDTVLWFLSIGFVLFLNVNNMNQPGYFLQILREEAKVLSVLAIWEYLANFYVFSLATELVLVPVLFILFATLGYASIQEKYKSVKHLLETILAIFGFFLIGFIAYSLAVDFQALVVPNSFREFFLPTIYTIFSLPYIYLLSIYLAYDQIFILLKYFSGKRTLADRLRIIGTFHINLKDLRGWQRYVARSRVAQDQPINIKESINNFKRGSEGSNG